MFSFFLCLPLEGKGDRLRWMRCFMNIHLHLISRLRQIGHYKPCLDLIVFAYLTASPQGEAEYVI
jgi:hypothetical protein